MNMQNKVSIQAEVKEEVVSSTARKPFLFTTNEYLFTCEC
jgi:hypothetical protein